MKKIILLIILSLNWLNIAISKQLKATPVKTKTEIQQVLKEYQLFKIIASVESRFNPKAYNQKENAAGIIQIRPSMLNEVNRIIGKKVYTDSCRFNPKKSYEMFLIILRHYKPKNLYQTAMLWNCGTLYPVGDQGKQYWKKIQKAKLWNL
jgi:hypothetical protein